MTLVARVPPGCPSERQYVLTVLFWDFLGVPINVIVEERLDTIIEDSDGPGRSLVLADTFFSRAAAEWLAPSSLPVAPLATFNLPPDLRLSRNDRLEVVFGRELRCGGFVREDEAGIELGVDVVGSAFFMLSRYEEAASLVRDKFGRFPAAASIASKGSFLDRPLVNEYLEVLWHCAERLWPRLTRRRRSSRLFLTHDVDLPCCRYRVPALAVLRHAMGDVVHRRDLLTARKRARSLLARENGPYDDPCYTFPMLMALSERHGLRSTFNFLSDSQGNNQDGFYGLDDSYIQRLIADIARRGHEIGYHASSTAATRPALIETEFSRLREVAVRVGALQDEWGGRYHYLRWSPLESWAAWDRVGLTYDSTLGYPEAAGFRTGCCYEYPVYDLLNRRPLRLRERSLAVMDVTLFSHVYQSFGFTQARDEVVKLAKQCWRFDGDLVLLWHNDTLIRPEHGRFLSDLIEELRMLQNSRQRYDH